MPKSLLEQLPEIVARGRQAAKKILESEEGQQLWGPANARMGVAGDEGIDCV